MWGWFIDNGVLILVFASLAVVLLLFFHEKVSNLISRIEPEKWHEKFFGNITAIFWTIEGIAVVVMVLAFVAVALAREGTRTLVVPDMIQEWFLAHGITVIIILVVGIVFWIVVKQTIPPLVRRVMSRPVRGESREGLKRRADTLQGVFLGLARIMIILLVIFMILSELKVNIGPILAGFGIIGIAVGFGAQYLIRDLIAGVFILMENQYRVGDVAKVADVAGLVEEINLRKTVLRDLDGIVHHVPNGEIRVASNYSRHFARVNLNVSVSYGTDLDFAIEVINRVCKEMAEEEKWAKVFRTVPQVLRVDKLGDSGIDIKIIGDVKPLEQWNVMGQLRLRLKREFDKAGIEIPWPHTKVYFGNKPGD
ncbi:MAG: mechanosensitive ion channel family protein [Chloroflexota bacterium]